MPATAAERTKPSDTNAIATRAMDASRLPWTPRGVEWLLPRANRNCRMLRAMRPLVVYALLLLASACDKPVAVEIPPPKVGVVTVLDAPVAEELVFPGRTNSPQRVDIRAQVEG